MTGEESERTAAEENLLNQMRKKKGEEWVEGREELILTQAKIVGEI